MAVNLKNIILSWRVLLLITFLLISILAIRPQIFDQEGVVIRSVELNSSSYNAGIQSPSSKTAPVDRERIISINRQTIADQEDYFNQLSQLKPNRTVQIETDLSVYTLLTKADENKAVDLGLQVENAHFSNLRKGLDLEGGMRILLKPDSVISAEDLDSTVSSLKERLNVYGLSDVVVRSASDLSGQDFVLIEIAGITTEEVKELL